MGDSRTTRRLVGAAAIACAALLAACGGGSGDGSDTVTTFVSVDGSPREPDEVGVLESVADDFSTLTLSGDRTFTVSPALQSFSTIDGSTQPLLRRVGQYVHVGTSGDTAEWVAGIGSVERIAGRPEVVRYLGTLERTGSGKAFFADGTVLRLAEGVERPVPPAELEVPDDAALSVLVTIDVASDEVTGLELQ